MVAQKANAHNQTDIEESKKYISRLDKKLFLRGQNMPDYRLRCSHVDYQEPVPVDLRHKSKKRGPLTLAEKI